MMVMVVTVTAAADDGRVGPVTAPDHVQRFVVLVVGTGRFVVVQALLRRVAAAAAAAVTLRRQHCLPENTITLYTSADGEKQT